MCRAEEPDAFERGKLLVGIRAEFLVVLRDVVAADAVEIIHRGVQADGAGNIRRAGLEPVRRVLPRALMKIDGQNHFAAALIRRHVFEHVPAGRTTRRCRSGRTSCGRRTRGNRSRSAARRWGDGPALCAASTSVTMPRLRARAQKFGDGIDRAERIGNVHHREELHVAGEELVEPAEIKQTVVTGDRAGKRAARRCARPAVATARCCCGAPSR